ncbi:hypothetical protein Tco_0255314 [Tanacetum coccineum]
MRVVNTLLGCISGGHQFSPHGRQIPGSESNLLRKQSIARAGEELTPNRKIIVSIGAHDKTPTSILSGPLSKHDITYRPRSSIKGQALANFLVECLRDDIRKEKKEVTGNGYSQEDEKQS